MIRFILDAIHAAQVEFHGSYSITRLENLSGFYNRAKLAHIFAVLAATPFPCLLVIIGFDLIPLQTPDAGYAANKGFWIRACGLLGVATLAFVEVFHRATRLPALSIIRITTITVFVSVIATAFNIGTAALVGFPIPFYAQTSSPPFFACLATSLFLTWRPYFQVEPDLVHRIVEYSKIWMVQSTTTAIYPIYFFVFRQLPPVPQGAFALLLPIFRVVIKNVASRCYRIHSDLRPEETVFNIEIMSALFVTFSMQNSASIGPVVLLTTVDIMHLCASLYDIRELSNELQETRMRLRSLRSRKEPRQRAVTSKLSSILDEALDIIYQMNESQRRRVECSVPIRAFRGWRISPMLRDTKSRVLTSVAAVLHITRPELNMTSRSYANGTKSISVLTTWIPDSVSHKSAMATTDAQFAYHQELFVVQALRFLHATEYVVLVEFTEVIIPTIYLIYLSIAIQLPNRQFYPQLETIDNPQLYRLVTNVAVYASLELITLLALQWIVWRRTGLSLVRQLAFVLAHHFRTIQAKLVLWVVNVVQCTLVHYGEDYTFRFQWLTS